VNNERKKDQLNAVTYETFEIIMDRLEKEYFDLVRPSIPCIGSSHFTVMQTKNIPKSDYAMPSEDSTCAICDDSEGENSNAIVFCDGCNLAVHQGIFPRAFEHDMSLMYQQTAMEFRTFPKASGYVASAPSPRKIQW
jgi:NuA3 HAT complex component NTO1